MKTLILTLNLYRDIHGDTKGVVSCNGSPLMPERFELDAREALGGFAKQYRGQGFAVTTIEQDFRKEG